MKLKDIKGVGPKTVKILNELKINELKDLLYYFPRDYENRNAVNNNITNSKDGDYISILGIVNIVMPYRKGYYGKGLCKIIFKCDNIFITAIWFNKPYMIKNFKVGEKVYLYGKLKNVNGQVQIIEPEYEKDKDDNLTKCNIVPIYPLSKNINQKKMQKLILNALSYIDDEINEVLPNEILQKYKLIDMKTAVKNIHYPENYELLKSSIKRLKFQELLLLQSALLYIKEISRTNKTTYLINYNKLINNFIKSLPYKLTSAQVKTIEEVINDMNSNVPMNRLVQGDVGCGKTIIAVIAMLNCVYGGYQAAMMAPTEILAEQHYSNIKALLSGFNINIELITSKIPKKKKIEIINNIKDGKINIIIGTHSLIQNGVEFKNLALVVTDEQHRFGVRQRAALVSKGINPHVLVMTATPIPRTLALFIYGDMDISIIDEMPPSRQTVATYYVNSKMRKRVYNFLKKRVDFGEQGYIVCPAIEDNEEKNIKSVEGLYEELKQNFFEKEKISIMHGKLNSEQKEKIMQDFKKGDIDILISTTVIEVGIDIKNATIIVIENADRFGLAQLHQLRGRVGRGTKKSYCILISDSKTKESIERMKVMEKNHDGFTIAEKDLDMRGSGEFFGVKQHGLPELKIADPVKDIELMKETRDLSKQLIYYKCINDKKFSKLKIEMFNIFKEVNSDDIEKSFN